MPDANGAALGRAAREVAMPLTGSPADFDALLERIGGARFVLIGEASHGTHDFYEQRAEITRHLIARKGFRAVVAEADWPDAYRVNRYVRGEGDANAALNSLEGFERFPAWMWRNTAVLDFIGWLRHHNDSLPAGAEKAGFYGMDLYSLNASIRAVLAYLDRVDPEAAGRARFRYACFEHFGEDTQAYGYSTAFGMGEACEREVVEQLVEMRRRASDLRARDGDEFFFAEQNARLVRNAEEYYRTMFSGRRSSWNLRDAHMADTLDALAGHLGGARMVVWAHNSHLGDARATSMGDEGEVNVGQLVRERHPREVYAIGQTTYAGAVTAAHEWDGPAEQRRVRPALAGSWEEVFHYAGLPRFLITLHDKPDFAQQRLERAIGVIYRPETERLSHYFKARLRYQFDAILHIDTTRALEPLERSPAWEREEEWETFPSGV